MNENRNRLTRAQRIEVVYNAIAHAPTPVSIDEIAALCGLRRTNYLLDILAELYQGDRIEWNLRPNPKNGAWAKVFYPYIGQGPLLN